jgi:hypothetical protein
VWAEFIAQYYAVKLVDGQDFGFADIMDFVSECLSEVHTDELIGSKDSFSMMCAFMLNCSDFEEILSRLADPDTHILGDKPYGAETQRALYDFLEYIYIHMQKEKPWKIDEDFIITLGYKFNAFRMYNSMFLGYMADPSKMGITRE